MSWLKRLLRSEEARAEPARPAIARANIESFGGRIVSLPEFDMIGQQVRSANGRLTLVWRDRYCANGRPVRGRYLLLDGDALVVDAGMERPQDGNVADDGTFILNDWGDSQTFSGTFHAFRADGSGILSRTYSANLLNNGLSDDGRLAVCQTANAPGSPDSSVLSVFDLALAKEVATWTAESGWASSYEFPQGGDRIRMIRRDRVSLDYALNGTFLDRRTWLHDEVGRGTLYVIRQALADGEELTGLTFDDLRSGIRQALADDDDRFDAEAWRLLGEIEEAAGDPGPGLAAYERALALNPKIGVAKRAAVLRNSRAASRR